MDVLGLIVMEQQIQSKQGINKSKLNIQNLSEGICFLKVNNTQTKFIKQ